MPWAYEYLPFEDDPSRQLLFSEPLIDGRPNMEAGRLLAGRIVIGDELGDEFAFGVNHTPATTKKQLGLPELTAVALKSMNLRTPVIRSLTASSNDRPIPGTTKAEKCLQASALRRTYATLGVNGQRAGCWAVGECFREGFFEADPSANEDALFDLIRDEHPHVKTFVPYTERFLQISALLGEGLLNPQIAERLDMKTEGIHTCIHRISQDLQVHTPELVLLAGALGHIPPRQAT